MGAVGKLLRSTDNGKTWTDAGALHNQDGPGWMAVGLQHKYVYAALWSHGLWRLSTGN